MSFKTTSPRALGAKFAEKAPFHSPQYRTKEDQEKAPRSIETALAIQPTSDEAKLNKLESDWLAVLRERGFDWMGIQPLGLKLADACRYHPDFVTLQNGQLTAWEVKGPHFWDDAKVKLKVAARDYPFIRFVLVTQKGGVWTETEVRI